MPAILESTYAEKLCMIEAALYNFTIGAEDALVLLDKPLDEVHAFIDERECDRAQSYRDDDSVDQRNAACPQCGDSGYFYDEGPHAGCSEFAPAEYVLCSCDAGVDARKSERAEVDALVTFALTTKLIDGRVGIEIGKLSQNNAHERLAELRYERDERIASGVELPEPGTPIARWGMSPDVLARLIADQGLTSS